MINPNWEIIKDTAISSVNEIITKVDGRDAVKAARAASVAAAAAAAAIAKIDHSKLGETQGYYDIFCE